MQEFIINFLVKVKAKSIKMAIPYQNKTEKVQIKSIISKLNSRLNQDYKVA